MEHSENVHSHTVGETIMKTQEFIDLVNGLDLEEFSDIPEDKVKYIGSRFGEQWDVEETHSTAMNIYMSVMMALLVVVGYADGMTALILAKRLILKLSM